MKILLPIDDYDCALRTVQWAAETFNKVFKIGQKIF